MNKIISGGQTGSDVAGLRAAKACGLETGGWVPSGCRTLAGPAPWLVTEFGCREHPSPQYPPRTYANVRDSDATLRLASDFTTAGEVCTLRAIEKYGKPHLDVDVFNLPPVAEVAAWLSRFSVVNVAGNSEKTCMGIESIVEKYLVEVFRSLP